jgi:hypothetical protein
VVGVCLLVDSCLPRPNRRPRKGLAAQDDAADDDVGVAEGVTVWEKSGVVVLVAGLAPRIFLRMSSYLSMMDCIVKSKHFFLLLTILPVHADGGPLCEVHVT